MIRIIQNEFLFQPKVNFGIMPIEYFEIPLAEGIEINSTIPLHGMFH